MTKVIYDNCNADGATVFWASSIVDQVHILAVTDGREETSGNNRG